MKKTIIIGAPHHNTLGIVRSLGAKGLKPDVYLVSRSKAPGCVKSKFINKIEFFESEESVVDHLLRKNSLGEKSILLLSSDSVSSAIDAKYNVLKNSYVFFNTQGHTTSWMSKEKMCVLATSLGMNVPKYFVSIILICFGHLAKERCELTLLSHRGIAKHLHHYNSEAHTRKCKHSLSTVE